METIGVEDTAIDYPAVLNVVDSLLGSQILNTYDMRTTRAGLLICVKLLRVKMVT